MRAAMVRRPAPCLWRGMQESQELISEASARLISVGFSVSIEDVSADARFVAQWPGSNDDLLETIEIDHGWPAQTAARYLQNLRVALSRKPSEAD